MIFTLPLTERDKISYLLQLDNDGTSPTIAKCPSNFSKQERAPEFMVVVLYLIIVIIVCIVILLLLLIFGFVSIVKLLQ